MFFLLRAEHWPYVTQQSLSVEALPGVAQCLSTLFIRTLCKDKDLLLKGYVTVSVSIEYLKVSVFDTVCACVWVQTRLGTITNILYH